ncbi:TadE/TadG family type IV pilus assembly protein [Streptomyces sp. TLI_171]|uniref:TadE/TadG family type IV pilus assembly protein n=1 Tax=Streptomyces sp. TLI_171 TaxID=1938859 RepID=UPI000C17FDF7|nr:TadE/TadG family type IV pilus assembly protein [Streptomyces sp. TLI_171]RKE22587.1 TadE-like protein [Streptomyces sp. TLI_171]
MTGRRARRRERDRGSFAVEAAILVPVVLTFALMAVAAGRVQTTGAVVDAAARSGARAASLARTPEGAEQAAADAVAQALADRGVQCATEPVGAPEYGTIGSGAGQLTTVTVRVACTVAFGDLLELDGIPGHKTITGTFTSVVDRYRGD